MIVQISQSFRDYDGMTVEAGQFTGEVACMGYSPNLRNCFWNIVSEGKVKAVTLGYPPHTQVIKPGGGVS